MSTLAKGDNNADMDGGRHLAAGSITREDMQASSTDEEVNSITPIGLAARHDFCSGYPRTFMTGTSAGCWTVASYA